MMYARNSITALVVIATLALHSGCQAQTHCTTNGWFGPNCQYQCHCAGSGTCDKDDGSCSSGCHQDWFGPACQYDRVGYSGPGWLTDSDDTTCTTLPVTVTLDTPIPLTWIRVVVRDAGDLNQIQLSYQLSGSPGPQTCTGSRKAKVNDLTLDIECSTTRTVSGVTLSGSGVTGLCSLYISGGRNVALKQPAAQSSRYNPYNNQNDWLASHAVDGTTGADTDRSTCTHTLPNTASPGWWTVTFSQAADVTRFLIFNRENCGQGCKDRLAGFTLTVQSDPSTATLYNYTDPGGPTQASYTVVPSPRISFPVSLVRFVTADSAKILTLCEVFVFGETNCPAGQFGLRCERQCNCANNGNCFVHSGGCPSGCAIGYTGEDCSECEAGRYGADCLLSCSATCGGDDSCDRADGACSQGCDPGYTGTICATQCVAGKYGAGCSETCSVHCAGSGDPCNHVTGHCDTGCEPGYRRDKCDRECDPGTYGAGCSGRCSVNCAGQNNACNHDTGTCDVGCDPGYWGDQCLNPCSSNCAGQDNACDSNNGHCNEGCDPGYRGNRCSQKCDLGTYGAGCSQRCSVNCAAPNNACNHVTGTCDVRCDVGYWGNKCVNNCSSKCGGRQKSCSRIGGACDICPPGYYGTLCSDVCSNNCAGSDNECDQLSGSCTAGCDPGYYGDKCLNTCSSNCGGSDKACDRDTGDCQSCPPGFQGAKCDQECDIGYYGAGCNATCSDHCRGKQSLCDHVNGTCDLGCDPGYQDSLCTIACSRGKYGPGCNQTCSIQCAGSDNPCHHVDGSCYLGCVQDDQSSTIRNAVPQREEQDGSGLNTTGFALMIVAVVAVVVAAVVIGILCWRLHRVSTELSLALARNEVREEAEVGSNLYGNVKRFAQQGVDANVRPNHYYEPVGEGLHTGDAREIKKTSVQEDRAGIRRSNQHYDHTETIGPENIHVYDTDFDHYDSPLNLMRASRAYEIPDPEPVDSESQDIDAPARKKSNGAS